MLFVATTGPCYSPCLRSSIRSGPRRTPVRRPRTSVSERLASAVELARGWRGSESRGPVLVRADGRRPPGFVVGGGFGRQELFDRAGVLCGRYHVVVLVVRHDARLGQLRNVDVPERQVDAQDVVLRNLGERRVVFASSNLVGEVGERQGPVFAETGDGGPPTPVGEQVVDGVPREGRTGLRLEVLVTHTRPSRPRGKRTALCIRVCLCGRGRGHSSSSASSPGSPVEATSSVLRVRFPVARRSRCEMAFVEIPSSSARSLLLAFRGTAK